MKKIVNFIIKSGIVSDNKNFVLAFLKNRWLMFLFRLRVDPSILLKNTFTRSQFSEVISEISIGPAFKTTSYNRHNNADDLITENVRKSKVKTVIDVGVSDGTSSVYLIESLKNDNAKVSLFDKYNFLDFYPKWYGGIYTNVDGMVVYVKLFCLILYVYPFLRYHKDGAKRIFFDNPILKQYKLKINYFDVFETVLENKIGHIKCANILNPVYFSSSAIKGALINLSKSLVDHGYIYFVHNSKTHESILSIRREGSYLVVDKCIDAKWLLDYLKINKRLKI